MSADTDSFIKLKRDLTTVNEKVNLCREMLNVTSGGIEVDEILAEVIGFLEACRDRLAELIESGTNGMLNEEIFSECLKTNDKVLRTLEAEKVCISIIASQCDMYLYANRHLSLKSYRLVKK